MESSRRLCQVFRSEGMLFLLIILLTGIHRTVSQGPEGYFDGTSYASLSTILDSRARISFSFRTCSSGQLLYQEGMTGDYVELALLPAGHLKLRWQVNRNQDSVTLGSNLIDNQWHDVDIIYSLGALVFNVSRNSVVIANSTFRSNLFDLQLESSHPLLQVGRGFTGCILQGAGVVLNDSSVTSFGVKWGKCPLPDRGDCDGYQVDHCFSQPCHKYSKCVSLQDDYECICTTRYSGRNCDIDQGPLCDKPEHNQCQNGGVCQEDKSGNKTVCACPPKFTGVHCETMIDNTFCDSKPCRNGGTCNINQYRDNYVCTCPQGFAGVDCELNIDECRSSPCRNNGSCTDEINAYSCDCTGTGYRGSNCEININECEESNPCYTGSVCFDRYGDYICDCPPGFGGKNCDQEVNECDSGPCQNGGSCIDNLNGYLCHCIPGFAGINCEENIDDCRGIACPENSHCQDGVESFSCVCDPGYSGAVPHCQEIDECATSPCLNGGTCKDQLNSFTCTCGEGFVGSNCEVDIDECNSAPCQNGATCLDGPGRYICQCIPGYTGVNCEVDVNDCESNPCENSARCVDLVNDFRCECLSGWEGKTCADNVNECLSQPCMHGQCIDSLNNFTCACSPGYTGRLCEADINECESSPCFNGGTCTDLVNDFSCRCPEDFMGKTCIEVYDACRSVPCQNEGTCLTTVPSHEYQCRCLAGYMGDNCEIDIDDCQGVLCPMGHVCFDGQNSYECRCQVGFAGPNCSENIDECSSNPCQNGTCVDGIGTYACQCPPGLTGKNCESDINECEQQPCIHGICKDMPGTYLCYCTPGYTGTLCDIEFNECLSSPCKNAATCNDLINDYSCDCRPGFSGRNCEVDIDECAPSPCLNGATCHDLINAYECTCIPGFSGVNCEVNIDECAPQPCQNNGVCVDLVNGFKCDCSESGFTGEFCETNIDDCESSPCQNGAPCEDQIKDYHCHCFKGYEGKNCETDINECTSYPCLNNALCLQNSNQTLYEMNYLGFYPSFSYENASGYRCMCASGFTGSNCETNIDDCEFNECINGICIDGIDHYECACHLGYDGEHCSNEIDECAMLEPCENEATCVDLVADYECKCLPDYGGKNCQTRLYGCLDVKCNNGATCIPFLDDDGQHSHLCVCPPGFHGETCDLATTVSFDKQGSMTVTRYNMLADSFVLEFRFRTTLSHGLLSSGSTTSDSWEYVLHLWNGTVRLDIYNSTNHVVELFSNGGQNDASWKLVRVTLETMKASLNVSGWVMQKSVELPQLNFSVQFGSVQYSQYDRLPFSDFIGCVQDVWINGDIVIPNRNGMLHGAVVGCPRVEQCESSPCHNGLCKDNWSSYECICSRPYFGNTCQYSYAAATFGYQDDVSNAHLPIPREEQTDLEDVIDITLFLRTRKDTGLVFYLGSSFMGPSNCTLQNMNNDTFMLARLISGKLQLILKQQNGHIDELTLEKKIDNGNYYFIQAVKNGSLLELRVNETSSSVSISKSSMCTEMVYIGGIPQALQRQKRQLSNSSRFVDKVDILLIDNITAFKGIIQDFRINDKEVVFYELDVQEESFPEIFGKAELTDTVRRGVVSDDPCSSLKPCFHGAQCNDIWNEYECVCPDDYRGKNCEERKPCAENNCPNNSECRNLQVGYECVASGAFDGRHSGIHYRVQHVNQDVSNITFSFRSSSNGSILRLESDQMSAGYNRHFLQIEIVSDALEVKWDLGPSYDNQPLQKTVSQKINDTETEWHEVKIVFESNLVHLQVSGSPENLSEDNYSMGLRELLANGANVYLGYNPNGSYYKGCLNDVRIGGLLLSFFDSPLMTRNPFVTVSKDVEIGCALCWDEDCAHGMCENRTESNLCRCDEGYEGRFCEIDMCLTKNPCDNDGICGHSVEGGFIQCTCPVQFMGPRCEEINHCEPLPCKNGGTCISLGDSYSCACSENYEGKNCEKPRILDCSMVECQHGTCLNIDLSETVKFNCHCYEGYEGMLCNETMNLCASSPCENGGNCTIHEEPMSASYHCTCPDGLIGKQCEINIDECKGNPCDRGTCVDGIGNFTCTCYPGYKGDFCSDKIETCSDSPTPCYNGNCNNTEEGIKCKCKTGYIGMYCSIWDECHASKCNDRGTCHPGHDETQLQFVHTCTCISGYGGINCSEKLAISGGEDDTNLILMILIPVMSLFIVCLLVGAIIFLRMAKKKRATRGTYSPSRQEMFGSRVEMNHVMKPPPEERLI